MAEPVKITHGFARQLRSRLVRWVSSPWFVLLLGLLTTLGAWRLTADEVRASAWLRFDNAAGDVEHAIQDRLKLYENSLRGAQPALPRLPDDEGMSLVSLHAGSFRDERSGHQWSGDYRRS